MIKYYLRGSILLLLFFIFVITFFLLLLCFANIGVKEDLEDGEYYEYSEFNLFNQSVTTIVKLKIPSSLKNEELVSYVDENTGNTIILSKIGGQKYKCFGTCSCSSYNRRYVSVSYGKILVTGVHLLVSSFSLYAAMKVAVATFKDQCSVTFRSDCDDDVIDVNIEGCDVLENEEEDDGREMKDHRYFCKGRCLENDEVKEKLGFNYYSTLEAWFGKTCDKMEYSETISLLCFEYSHTCKARAEEKFSDEYLSSFCKEVSSFRASERINHALEMFSTSMKTFLCDSYAFGNPPNSFEHIDCLGIPE